MYNTHLCVLLSSRSIDRRERSILMCKLYNVCFLNLPINLSITQSVNQTDNHTTNQSNNLSIKKQINQSIVQKYIHQTTNQSIKHCMYKTNMKTINNYLPTGDKNVNILLRLFTELQRSFENKTRVQTIYSLLIVLFWSALVTVV